MTKRSTGKGIAMRDCKHEYLAFVLILGLLVVILQSASVAGKSVPGLNGAPSILSGIPESPAFDTEGNVRTFNIVLDQKATVRWTINGQEVFSESDVTQSTYTMTNAPAGVWEVSATASNPNGATKHQWTWIVYGAQHSQSSGNDSNGVATKPSKDASDTAPSLPLKPAADTEQSLLPLIGGVCIFTVGATLTIFFLKRIER